LAELWPSSFGNRCVPREGFSPKSTSSVPATATRSEQQEANVVRQALAVVKGLTLCLWFSLRELWFGY